MTGDTLKKSILQLAVTGKLVSQNSKDEPASKLLEKINKEREKLIKEEKLKKQKFKPVQEEDIPFKIPKSWCWVNFGEIVNFYVGKTPDKQNTDYWCNPKYNWISITDMVSDGITNNSAISVSEKAFQDCFSNKISPKGTLIMSFKLTIGKVSILGKEAFHNEAIISIFPLLKKNDSEILKNYLFKILPIITKLGDKKRAVKGATLNTKSLNSLLIPLPPLEEQKRIVKKLEQILPLVEEYGKNEEKLLELNKSLPDKIKQSILQYAVQGKLVKQNPNDEPASKLLDRIKAEKDKLIKEGKIKKDKNQSYIFRRDNSHYEKIGNTERCINDEIPFEIPKSWQWVRLKSICIINPKYNAGEDIDAGFVPMALINDGYIGGHSFQIKKWKYIKKGFTHFENGDLVIAKITPCFENRKSTIIENLPNNIGAGTTELHVIKNYATAELNINYLLLLVKTADFISKGIKSFTGTAGQQRISKNYIEQYLIPLPPIQEQKRIVKKVKQIFSYL